ALDAAPEGASRPAWAESAGQVRLTGSWAMSDVYGDQTEYILSFAYDDEKLGGVPHAVCVLVDFNVGAVKDCWTALDPERILADCRRSAATDEDLLLGEVDPTIVRTTVAELFAATDRLPELPESQGLSEERSAVLARVATLPAPEQSDAAGTADGAQRVDRLVADFLAAPEGTVEGADREILEACVRLIAEYSVAENRPDPLRWSPVTVEMFLTDWAPRAAVIDDECVRWVPTVLAAFVTYAGRLSERPDRVVAATQEAVTTHLPIFAESMFGVDTENATAAQVARQLIADGIDPTDDAAVRAWLDSRLRPS
ncbi:MAG: hypothetical protein WCA46_08050, partial [Actinocatenispora sp.]